MAYATRGEHPRKSITIALEGKLLDMITIQAYEERRSRSALINQALEEYLSQYGDLDYLETEVCKND